jgi:formylmethanofuran dehydrogenase subunit D
MKEAAELRGRLNAIALAFECTLCFEKLGAGSVSFGCGHTYCNRATCGSRLVDTCPECRLPVASRVQLFGALPDVGGLLEQEPAAPDVEQVQRIASENAKAIRKRSEEEKVVWQHEKKEMQQQVNRLQEEVLAAANANASLEEIRVQQNDHINKLLNIEKMRTKQVTPELDAFFLAKKDALQQHVAEQTKESLSEGNKENSGVPLPAAPPLNKKQKQNIPGKACDADSFFAQLAGLSRQGDEAAIVQGMLTHSEHAGVQQQACEVLRSLAYDAGKRSKIAEAGGIEAVVAGMQAHKTSVLVQEPACAALRSLAFNDSNKVKIAGAGGIEAVVSAMKAHTASVFVQQHACAALWSLALNAGNKVKIAEADGIEAVVAGMQAHKTSVLVQQPACWALSNLAVNAGNQVRIAEAGGIEAVVSAMKAHKTSVLVQQHACAALKSLALNAGNKVKIAEAGGIEAVVSAMQAHKTSGLVHEPAWKVWEAMEAHQASGLVQEQACAALSNLAVNDGNKVKIAEAGGIEAVVAAMEAHKTSVLVHEPACLALWYLAAQGSLRQRIKAAGGVECVKHAVNASNATANTKRWGNNLLDKLK